MNHQTHRFGLITLLILGTGAAASSAAAQPAAAPVAPPVAAPPVVAPPVAAPPVAAPPVAAPPVAVAPVAAPPVAAPPVAAPAIAAEPPAAAPPATDPLAIAPVAAEVAPVAAAEPTALAAEPALPAAPKKESGFFIESADGNYKLKVGGYVQPRFTYTAADSGDDEFAFAIARARLQLSGNAITPDLAYNLHVGWDTGNVPTLKDGWLDYKFHKAVQLCAGQMKKPFSRQAMMSDTSLEFVERSLVDAIFGPSRDLGVMVHNSADKSPKFEYGVGVFNGTGDKPVYSVDVEHTPPKVSATTTPKQLSPLVAARLGYNHGDVKSYSEADLEGGPVRFGLAGATQVQLDADDDNSSGVAATLDFMVKAHGFSTTGGYFVGWASTGEFADQEYARSGINVQASYAIHKMVVPGVRYAHDIKKGEDNDTQEILGVVGFYPWGSHSFKVQVDGGALIREGETDSSTDIRVRAQAQAAF